MTDENNTGNDAPITGGNDMTPPPAPVGGDVVQGSDEPQPNAGLASLSHWSFLMGMVVPFASLILPLVLLNTTGKTDNFVAENAKEALNLLIAAVIFGICCIPLLFIVIGFFLLIALTICLIVFPIIAAIQTMSSTMSTPVYRYPLIFRLIK